MKIRLGFVSNSSSSSYVCVSCGDTIEGMDVSLSDNDFYECINGHIVCGDCLLEDFEYDEEDPEYNEEWDSNYEIPEKYCPVCGFVEPDYDLLKKYFIQLYGITEEEVFAEVKSKNKRRKKLYSNEYVNYVMGKNGIFMQGLLDELKNKFETFKSFRNEVNKK